MLEEKDTEILSLSTKLTDLTARDETLVEKESNLQQKVDRMNHGKDKLEEIQPVQRSPIIKSWIFTGQKIDKNQNDDCRITFVNTTEKSKVDKLAHQSLHDKRLKLKNAALWPQAMLVKEHAASSSKSQPTTKPAASQKENDWPIPFRGWSGIKKK